jgi:hypothetical protein
MLHRLMSDQKASALLMALSLVGMAVLGFTGNWWPALYGVIGLPVAVWCFVRGRWYDAMLIAILSSVGWATAEWVEGRSMAVPVLISVAALYTLFRELLGLDPEGLEDLEEEVESEIQEGSGKQPPLSH